MSESLINIDGRFYDTGTNNESFLQVANQLKDSGVKNWYFMLEIKDPSLIKVDPYAVDEETGKTKCTEDQIQRILNECRTNIWYYLREIVRIPSLYTNNGIPYASNRGTIAQAWCLLHGIDSWLCIVRQNGYKTKSALALQSWIYLFANTNTQINFINKDEDNVKENLKTFSDMIKYLPEYMQFNRSSNDHEESISKTIIANPITKNSVSVKSRAVSNESALALSRSITAPILHFDECEFIPYIDVIVENSVYTFKEASRKAREDGNIYGRLFTSTPAPADSDSGKRALSILSKTIEWTEKMYDWSMDELEKYIHQEGKNDIVYIEYSYKELGLTDEWFVKTSALLEDPSTIKRELLLEREINPFE